MSDLASAGKQLGIIVHSLYLFGIKSAVRIKLMSFFFARRLNLGSVVSGGSAAKIGATVKFLLSIFSAR